MNNLFYTTKKAAFIATSLLLAACTTELYVPEKGPEVDPNGKAENGIPNNVTWKTTTTKSLTVNVNDEYESQYYYTVEVLDANPVFDNTAKLIAGAKTNAENPFYVKDLVIPATLENLYIRVIDPFGQKSIYTVAVQEGNMVCDFTPKKETKTRAAEENLSLYGDNSRIIEKATERSKSVSVTELKDDIDGGSYKIVNNLQLEKDLNIKNAILYIEGSLHLKESELNLINSTVYVLKNGNINAEGNKGSIDCKVGSDIFNGGKIFVDAIKLDKNTTGDDCVLYNTGFIHVKSSLEADGAQIHNHCLLKVNDELKLDGAGSSIYVYGGGVITKTFKSESLSNIYQYPFTIIKVTQEMILEQQLSVTGYNITSGTDWVTVTQENYPLFTINKLDLNSNGLKFNSYCQYSISKCDEWNWISGGILAEGTPSTKLDNTECNDNNGNQGGGTGPGDNDDTYIEKNPVNYVYMFEDNWPSHGDYDMNDMVISVNVANKKKGNEAVGVILEGMIQAVGATKQLALGFQLDGVTKGNIKSVEGIGSFESENPGPDASFMLVKDVHRAMGRDAGKSSFINTYAGGEVAPYQFNIEIDYASAVAPLSSDELNMFIAYGSTLEKGRSEIHLPGAAGTGWAATSNSSVNYKYQGDEQDYINMPWGLKVVSSNFAGYPKETVNIKDAYEGFTQWATSGNQAGMDWYIQANDGKTIKVTLSEN